MPIPYDAVDFHFGREVADYYKEITNKIHDSKKMTYNEARLLLSLNDYFETVQTNLKAIPEMAERVKGERLMRKDKCYRRTSELVDVDIDSDFLKNLT